MSVTDSWNTLTIYHKVQQSLTSLHNGAADPAALDRSRRARRPSLVGGVRRISADGFSGFTQSEFFTEAGIFLTLARAALPLIVSPHMN